MLDAVIESAAGARRYYSDDGRRSLERLMYGFKYLIGSNCDAGEDATKTINRRHAYHIKNCVRPLTEDQGDRGWHIMRAQSCTSSCMDRVISAKAPFISSDDPLYEDYKLGILILMMEIAAVAKMRSSIQCFIRSYLIHMN